METAVSIFPTFQFGDKLPFVWWRSAKEFLIFLLMFIYFWTYNNHVIFLLNKRVRCLKLGHITLLGTKHSKSLWICLDFSDIHITRLIVYFLSISMTRSIIKSMAWCHAAMINRKLWCINGICFAVQNMYATIREKYPQKYTDMVFTPSYVHYEMINIQDFMSWFAIISPMRYRTTYIIVGLKICITK